MPHKNLKKIFVLLALWLMSATTYAQAQHICTENCVAWRDSGSGPIVLTTNFPDTIKQGEEYLISWTSRVKFDVISIILGTDPHHATEIHPATTLPDTGSYCWRVNIYTAGFGPSFPRPLRFKVWICGVKFGMHGLSHDYSKWLYLKE